MGKATLDARMRQLPNLPKDRVGDVFEIGIMQVLKTRFDQGMLQHDKCSVICFDDVVEKPTFVG